MAGRSCTLQGQPGSGKTTMACLTAVKKPVHAIDLDRKISTMSNLQRAIHEKQLTFWEVSDPLVESGLTVRAKELATNEKNRKAPKGWYTFADFVDNLDRKDEAKACGTLLIDSYTRLGTHLDRHLANVSDNTKGNMRPQDWKAYLMMMQEATTIIIDWARNNGKDVIFTIHERQTEVPGPNTKVIKSKAGDSGMMNREYLGALDLRVAGTVQGQFGTEFGSYFEEVYGLSVDIDKDGQPKWVCRVQPDGKRDLRTTFTHRDQMGKIITEFPCDFTKIWR